MSDYHVLANNEEETKWEVVFHIPVPAINNAIGYPVRTITVNVLNPQNEAGAIVSTVQWITAPEQAQLEAGELWEIREFVPVGKENTVAQKRAIIEARYNEIVAVDRGEILARYNYYGYDGTVA